jgi:hypothetical protein
MESSVYLAMFLDVINAKLSIYVIYVIKKLDFCRNQQMDPIPIVNANHIHTKTIKNVFYAPSIFKIATSAIKKRNALLVNQLLYYLQTKDLANVLKILVKKMANAFKMKAT